MTKGKALCPTCIHLQTREKDDIVLCLWAEQPENEDDHPNDYPNSTWCMNYDKK